MGLRSETPLPGLASLLNDCHIKMRPRQGVFASMANMDPVTAAAYVIDERNVAPLALSGGEIDYEAVASKLDQHFSAFTQNEALAPIQQPYEGKEKKTMPSGRVGPPDVYMTTAKGHCKIIKGVKLFSGPNFSSVVGNVAVYKGKWMYEVQLGTSGIMQIGWTGPDMPYTSEEGIGDFAGSYAYDGKRIRKWDVYANTYGQRWASGDIITTAIDLDAGSIIYWRNGVCLGEAFKNIPAGQAGKGYLPGISLSFSEECRVNFGARPFKYPVKGYAPLQAPPSKSVINSSIYLAGCLERWLEVTAPREQRAESPCEAAALAASRAMPYASPMTCSDGGSGFDNHLLGEIAQHMKQHRGSGALSQGDLPLESPLQHDDHANENVIDHHASCYHRRDRATTEMRANTVKDCAQGKYDDGTDHASAWYHQDEAAVMEPPLPAAQALLLASLLGQYIARACMDHYLIESMMMPVIENAANRQRTHGDGDALNRLLCMLCTVLEREELNFLVSNVSAALGRQVRCSIWNVHQVVSQKKEGILHADSKEKESPIAHLEGEEELPAPAAASTTTTTTTTTTNTSETEEHALLHERPSERSSPPPDATTTSLQQPNAIIFQTAPSTSEQEDQVDSIPSNIACTANNNIVSILSLFERLLRCQLWKHAWLKTKRWCEHLENILAIHVPTGNDLNTLLEDVKWEFDEKTGKIASGQSMDMMQQTLCREVFQKAFERIDAYHAMILLHLCTSKVPWEELGGGRFKKESTSSDTASSASGSPADGSSSSMMTPGAVGEDAIEATSSLQTEDAAASASMAPPPLPPAPAASPSLPSDFLEKNPSLEGLVDHLLSMREQREQSTVSPATLTGIAGAPIPPSTTTTPEAPDGSPKDDEELMHARHALYRCLYKSRPSPGASGAVTLQIFLLFLVRKNATADKSVPPPGLSPKSSLVSVFFAILRLLRPFFDKVHIAGEAFSLSPALFMRDLRLLGLGKLKHYSMEMSRLGGLLSHLVKESLPTSEESLGNFRLAEESIRCGWSHPLKPSSHIVCIPDDYSNEDAIDAVDVESKCRENTDKEKTPLYCCAIPDELSDTTWVQENILQSVLALYHFGVDFCIRTSFSNAQTLAQAVSSLDQMTDQFSFDNSGGGAEELIRLSIKECQKTILESLRRKTWFVTWLMMPWKQESCLALSCLVAKILAAVAERPGPMLSFVPEHYLEAMLDLMHFVRRATNRIWETPIDVGAFGLDTILGTVITLCADPRIVSPEARNMLIQTLLTLINEDDMVEVVVTNPTAAKKLMPALVTLLADERSWPVVVNIFGLLVENTGYAWRYPYERSFPGSEEDQAVLYALTERARALRQGIIPWIQTALRDQTDRVTSFFNVLFDRVNWIVTELVVAVEEFEDAVDRNTRTVSHAERRVSATANLCHQLLRLLETVCRHVPEGILGHKRGLNATRLAEIIAFGLRQLTRGSKLFDIIMEKGADSYGPRSMSDMNVRQTLAAELVVPLLGIIQALQLSEDDVRDLLSHRIEVQHTSLVSALHQQSVTYSMIFAGNQEMLRVICARVVESPEEKEHRRLESAMLSLQAMTSEGGAGANAAHGGLGDQGQGSKDGDGVTEGEETDAIPEEFLDPIMLTLMEDPIILPHSGITVDRSTIERHMLSSATDPFSRAALIMEDLKPDKELLQKIDDWKKGGGLLSQ